MALGTLTTTLAYIGPGPGLSMTWALIALVGTVLSAVVAVLFWPVKMVLRRLRSRGDGDPGVGTGSGMAAGPDADVPSGAEGVPASDTAR